MRKLLGLLVLMAGLGAVVSGCAKPAPRCVAPEDNPEHHYLRGMELLAEEKVSEASAKFERAVWCDEKFSPGHSALAIVHAKKASLAEERYRQVDSDKAFEELKLAWKHASTPEDEFAYHLASMRLYTAMKPRKWLGYVEDGYKSAMKPRVDERKLIYYEGREAASYFMGVAYLDSGEFQAARDSFAEVLNSKKEGRWNAPADKGWKKTDKIVRALAGITLGDVGKSIAVKESIARGDMAALLVDELKIDKLFAGRIPVKYEAGKKAEFTPVDTLESPFKEEILSLIKWGVRGLEPAYDDSTRAYLFRPSEPVIRKEFALVIEDVLIKLTGDDSIARAFFGHQKSPFPDVPPTAAWYNAVMNVTTRNIMETELSGEFRPEEKVDGAEAVLAIRVLRQRLNIY